LKKAGFGRLIKDTLIYGLGMMSVRLFNFIFLPIISRRLSPKEFAIYDLIFNSLSLIIPLVTFNIAEAAYRFMLTEENKENREKIIKNCLVVLIKSIIVVSVVYMTLRVFVIGDIIFLSFNVYIWCIMAIVNAFLVQLCRANENSLLYSINSITYALITISSNIITVYVLNLKINGLINSNIVGLGVSNILLIYLLKLKFNMKISKDRELMKEMLKYSIPMAVNTINWWIMSVSDRFLSYKFVSVNELGIYSMANKVVSILAVIYTVFYLGWQSMSIKVFDKLERDVVYTKVFNGLVTIFMCIIIMSVFFSDNFVAIFLGEKYYLCYKFVPVLALSMAFQNFASFYGTIYLSLKSTKTLLYTSILSTIINVSINFVFLRVYGIKAAVISSFLSFFIMWIIRVIDSRKYIKINIYIYNYVLFAISLVSFSLLK